MEWIDVQIEVSTVDTEKASAIATMAVPYGIYIEDYSHLEEEAMEIAHIDLIDDELLQKSRTISIIHIYLESSENPDEAIAYLTERLEVEKIEFTLSTNTCIQEDWLNSWKKYFKPTEVGEKLLIRPIWEEVADTKGRLVLDLEPGIAFGTGTHETTCLCMELLEQTVTDGCEILDIGCGSGILSICALLLGAKKAIGVDIDSLAVKTAIENAKINKMEDRFTGVCGDLTEHVSGRFDLVASNIVADVIISLSHNITSFLKPTAKWIVSGIIDAREADVMEAIAGRFIVLERREQKGWVALTLSLKSDDTCQKTRM